MHFVHFFLLKCCHKLREVSSAEANRDYRRSVARNRLDELTKWHTSNDTPWSAYQVGLATIEYARMDAITGNELKYAQQYFDANTTFTTARNTAESALARKTAAEFLVASEKTIKSSKITKIIKFPKIQITAKI